MADKDHTLGEGQRENIRTIIVLGIKHVEHLGGVLYLGVVTGMHDFRKSGRKQDWE